MNVFIINENNEKQLLGNAVFVEFTEIEPEKEVKMQFSGSFDFELNYQNFRSMLRKLRNHKHKVLKKRQYSLIRKVK